MIRIVLVEDQTMLRDSLACTINAQQDMEVVASLADAADALEATRRTGAACALLDVCTENDSSGIVAARLIKEALPDVRVVTGELLGIIRSTMEGYSTFPLSRQRIIPDGVELSQVEIDILRLVCESKTRREIAAELYLSEGTVKRHISEILLKTGYDNILRLAVHAVSNGLIVPGMGRRDE
jgi:DNA-binding NarL/FixJ family response regulator